MRIEERGGSIVINVAGLTLTGPIGADLDTVSSLIRSVDEIPTKAAVLRFPILRRRRLRSHSKNANREHGSQRVVGNRNIISRVIGIAQVHGSLEIDGDL
jgi:hypothetical protein